MDFTGKCVLITGGSRGIGRAAAVAFAARGAKVVFCYRHDFQEAEKTLKLMQGEDHRAIQADIAHPEEARQLVEQAFQHMGRLDILVNNAGIFVSQPIDTISYEDWQLVWENTMNINLIGPANVTYWAVQYMIKEGGGRIVNVSSRGAFRGEPKHTAYGASKAGLNSFSQSLAQELAPYNIFVGVIAPGFVETDMVAELLESDRGEDIKNQSPLGRAAQPEEIAFGILFLASEESIYSTGAILDMNGASYLRS